MKRNGDTGFWMLVGGSALFLFGMLWLLCVFLIEIMREPERVGTPPTNQPGNTVALQVTVDKKYFTIVGSKPRVESTIVGRPTFQCVNLYPFIDNEISYETINMIATDENAWKTSDEWLLWIDGNGVQQKYRLSPHTLIVISDYKPIVNNGGLQIKTK